jgi:hypothetical protein
MRLINCERQRDSEAWLSHIDEGIEARLARPWDWADYAALNVLARGAVIYKCSDTPVADVLEHCSFDLEDEQFRAGIAELLRGEARLVTVCSACLKASCWRGLFMCDESQNAGTVELPVSALIALNREHSDYWTDKGCEIETDERSR